MKRYELSQAQFALIEDLLPPNDADGRIDVDLWLIDSTVIRAGAAAAGARRKKMSRDEPTDHALGRSRGGFGTKIHLVTDGSGVPLGAVLSAGPDHDSRYVRPALYSVRIKRSGAGRPITRPKAVAGDKGYSYASVRDYLATRRIKAIIPTRSDQKRRRGFDKSRYRKRNAIERCVGWLKWSRRLETRHEKLAVNYLAMTKLAMIKRCARLAA